MRVIYNPQTSEDEPGEFGILLPAPLGLKPRFHHLERIEVERLMHSCEFALREADGFDDPVKLHPTSESTMVL